MEIKREERKIYVNKYVAFDGREFNSMSQCDDYEKRKRGERIVCDKCNGKGYFSKGFHEVLNELTYQYEEVEYTETCSKCNGKGYLDKVITWK